MGREIRRVPANWEHPKYTSENCYRSSQIEQFIPLHHDYPGALKEFQADIAKMGLGQAIDYLGGGPKSDDYADYKGQPLEWYQVYETVTEGTPVSPAFATQQELIHYLIKNGDFWDQAHGDGGWNKKAAERFVLEAGWCPTAVFTSEKGFQTGIDALNE